MVADLARTWGTRILQPLARFFGSLGLTANALTVVGFFLTVGVAAVLATGRTQLAGLLFIFTLGFDAVDGTLARLTGTTSRFGAFLDSTLDRWAEIAIYLALIWLFLTLNDDRGVLLAAVALSASLMVSYTRARAEGIGIACKEGMLTRFERLVILIIGLIFNLTPWALGIIAVLATVTAVQRIVGTWQLAAATKK
jgi:CDP-diacylglycerol---glycerol-3-phosphate 3-phosphatidyltransferase